MLTFISPWRAAAVVLCDMASTAWYIGGIAERAMGQAAPWFVLAVMAFSALVLAMYVEASAMFVRGGVYRVVKESMGPTGAKISVSALMFDYVLTGAISSVSAGQYLAGLLNSAFPHLRIGWQVSPPVFSMIFAIAVTLYFWRQNIRGIEESSDKALKIMKLVTVMGGILIIWSLGTVLVRGFNWPQTTPSLSREGLGWLAETDWHKTIGGLGLLIAFGHAFLGMSGLETLAQVYREMEAPKLENLKRTALGIWAYAFLLTGGLTFLAVGIVPAEVRARFADNLLSGLALSMAGPRALTMIMQAFVVVVGTVILAGAVNTSIMGSNGVMNRLAEDGVMPEWFRWLHPRFGTTHRMIDLIVVMQVVTILLCRGDLYLLGEAYAFGVIWSFVFMAAACVMLRFKLTGAREWVMPGNLGAGTFRLPLGLGAVFFVMLAVGFVNLATKKVATISGLLFTMAFYVFFQLTERYGRKAGAAEGERGEKVNLRQAADLAEISGEITKPHRVLVAVGDPKRLQHLAKALETLDSETTDLVVMHSKIERGLGFEAETVSMGPDEEQLYTRVIAMAEKAGKTVLPVLVVSNDPFYAMAQSAQAVGATEVVMGVSDRVATDTHLERLAMTWGALQPASAGAPPVRFRVVGPSKETFVDL